MSRLDRIDELDNSPEDEYNSERMVSKTAIDMSEIISVLDGRSTVFEVDKSIRSKTDKVADALMGDKGPDLAEEQRRKEKKQRKIDRKERRVKYYLDDDIEAVDQAKERMDGVYDLLDQLEVDMLHILHNQSVEYYTPIPKAGGFVGKIMYKLRSGTRHFLEFIFASVLKQQNELNSWIARTEEKNVGFLREYGAAVREECLTEIKMQERRNEILEEKVIKQEKMIEKALQEIDELKQKQGVEK